MMTLRDIKQHFEKHGSKYIISPAGDKYVGVTVSIRNVYDTHAFNSILDFCISNGLCGQYYWDTEDFLFLDVTNSKESYPLILERIPRDEQWIWVRFNYVPYKDVDMPHKKVLGEL